MTLNEMQRVIGTWADRVFPDRTVHTTLAKLVLEEIPEFLLGHANDPLEYADLVILILDVAHQKGIDVEAAVWAKHETNVRRSWARTSAGVFHHVEGASLAREDLGTPPPPDPDLGMTRRPHMPDPSTLPPGAPVYDGGILAVRRSPDGGDFCSDECDHA